MSAERLEFRPSDALPPIRCRNLRAGRARQRKEGTIQSSKSASVK